MAETRIYRWCEFATKGSGGNIMSWHLVTMVGNAHRSMCGRLLTATPENISNRAPKQIRGVCRRCEVMARLDKSLDPALLR